MKSFNFTTAAALAYISTTDKAAFLVTLLDLRSINQLTEELENDAEAALLALL